MPRIPSANNDFKQVTVPGQETGYVHPAELPRQGRSSIPMAFQVTSPLNRTQVLFPHALVCHVNPMSISESHNQKKEVIQTRGGFVEQHWGHDLVEISADQSTGAFMNIRTGLSSVLRQRTIAWDRFRDLHDLYKHNGSVYDPHGAIVLQGQVMLMYDRGTYLGTFRSFEFEESDDAPFVFSLNWSFKVEHTVMQISQDVRGGTVPRFQVQNVPANNQPPAPDPEAPQQRQAEIEDQETQREFEVRRSQEIAKENAIQKKREDNLEPEPGASI